MVDSTKCLLLLLRLFWLLMREKLLFVVKMALVPRVDVFCSGSKTKAREVYCHCVH